MIKYSICFSALILLVLSSIVLGALTGSETYYSYEKARDACMKKINHYSCPVEHGRYDSEKDLIYQGEPVRGEPQKGRKGCLFRGTKYACTLGHTEWMLDYDSEKEGMDRCTDKTSFPLIWTPTWVCRPSYIIFSSATIACIKEHNYSRCRGNANGTINTYEDWHEEETGCSKEKAKTLWTEYECTGYNSGRFNATDRFDAGDKCTDKEYGIYDLMNGQFVKYTCKDKKPE